MAGDKWYCGFILCHLEISLRQGHMVSSGKMCDFFFLVILVEDYKLHATRIFEMDETDFFTVQK
jgi:hypothetical protein